eukprot:5188335-Pyramimonas_sp.AAC.1
MGRKADPEEEEGFRNFFDSDFAGLGGGSQDGSNALVLESKKVRKQKAELERKQAPQAPAADKKLSKSQRKRLANLEEQREKKRHRAAAYEALQKNAISADH